MKIKQYTKEAAAYHAGILPQKDGTIYVTLDKGTLAGIHASMDYFNSILSCWFNSEADFDRYMKEQGYVEVPDSNSTINANQHEDKTTI